MTENSKVFGVRTRIGARILLSLSFPIAAALCATTGIADEVRLTNGDRLTGKITGVSDGKLSVDTTLAGKVAIPLANIVGMTTDNPVTVEFAAGGYATGALGPAADGTTRLSGPNQTESKFAATAIKQIHPDGKIPVPQFKWAGRVNVGASRANGNTETEAYHIDTEAVGRGEKDRILLGGELNREKTDGTSSADNARIYGQYDRFISKKWYLNLRATGEQDDFADLAFRTTVGAGVGYQVIETDLTKLSFEAGPTWVNEDFETAPDQRFMAGRWAVNFSAFVFDKFAQIFHNHDGLVNFENSSDVLIRSRTGLRIPFREMFNVSLQHNLDWDNVPAPGRKKTDSKYILSVGYTW